MSSAQVISHTVKLSILNEKELLQQVNNVATIMPPGDLRGLSMQNKGKKKARNRFYDKKHNIHEIKHNNLSCTDGPCIILLTLSE